MTKTRKTITFLLLHLGYGGIESATINSANALAKEHDVSIVSFYNLKNNQIKELNENIKIKFLYNGEPNREEFKQAVKSKNLFKVLKEGLKATSILLKKKYLVIKEIKNLNSDVIVSTNVTFSILLSKYGNKNSKKVAQEHHHHNNDKKYINKLKNKYNNIDYLCALTTTLKKDYEIFLEHNKHTKVILLPNMLVDFPVKVSKLNNNLITIGRLHKGKCIDEMIKLFSKIKNKKTKLYVIGDGDEYNNISKLIKDLKLEKRVIMLGYLSHKEQEEYLLKSRGFLMTSISEGLPMVLLEAMSYGIPCIAYETESGVADIIDNNKNGYIIKNRDEKEYINKVNYLINNNKTLEELSENALKKSQLFSEEEILKRWKKIL